MLTQTAGLGVVSELHLLSPLSLHAHKHTHTHTHTHTYSLHSQLISQLPTLGHCVSVLLDTLHTHQSKAVRRAAMGSLLALTRVNAEQLVECLGMVYTLAQNI